MPFSTAEAIEVTRMVEQDSLDIRAVTMGISLLDCNSDKLEGPDGLIDRICSKIRRCADRLVEEADNISAKYGIPITNKRISITPLSLVAGQRTVEEYVEIAQALDKVAKTWDTSERVKEGNEWKEKTKQGITFLGGYSALIHKGWTEAERVFVDSIPAALAATERVCSSLNIASTKSGINMDAVRRVGELINEIAAQTGPKAVGCVKFVVFANAVEDNPFMAGAFHGVGEPECVINVGISGPEVVRRVVRESRDVDFIMLAERIKRAVFKVVRAGELVGDALSARLSPNAEFGIIDLSLAPVPSETKGHPEIDSLAAIIEEMGIERCGYHGTLAALALLIDAVKRGGAMASSRVGGLSGTFIPVSEDLGMDRAVADGVLTLDRVQAMTAVCSVGLDMVAIPGDTPATTIAAIIADEMAIGVMNNKTTGVRIIPVPGKNAGDIVDWTDINKLLGKVHVMAVNPKNHSFSSEKFINRTQHLQRIPAPIRSLTN